MKKILLIGLTFFLVNHLFAQVQPSQIIKTFFQKYKENNSDEAVDYFFSQNSYAEDMEEGVDNVKRALRKQKDALGLFYGRDSLSMRSAGPNLQMYTFLVRHARQPLLFYLTFYKAENRWVAYSFRFTTEVTNELEEASKLYRLKENY